MEPLIGQALKNDQKFSINVTLQNFGAEVIEASETCLVIIDFWASWSEPCRQVTPILEKVVSSFKGAVRLAKINIEESPQIAQQFNIQSLPTVVLFKEGRPLTGFTGLITETQLKQLIEKIIGPQVSSTEETLKEANEALIKGLIDQAQMLFTAVLQKDPSEGLAQIGLARCYWQGGDFEKAKAYSQNLPEKLTTSQEFISLKTALDLAEAAKNKDDRATLEKKIQNKPDDFQGRLDLSLVLFTQNQPEQAMEELLSLIKKDPLWNDQAAKNQLLRFFEALGHSHPLTLQNRKKLSVLLFS
jgi:putative thioredoxin